MQTLCKPSSRFQPWNLAGDESIDVHVTHGHALLAAGIRATLAPHARVAPAGSPPSSGDRTPVVITDMGQALQWRCLHGGSVLVVESGLTVRKVKALLHTGVQGCISADGESAELLVAVQTLGSGGNYFCPRASGLLADALTQPELTHREQHVLELLCDGLDNKSIAAQMRVALGTVKCHVKSILAKTQTTTRTAVAAQAIRQGWVKPVPT